jgi:hypothetical protein
MPDKKLFLFNQPMFLIWCNAWYYRSQSSGFFNE